MGISEANTVSSHLVEVRRWDAAFRVVTTEVTVAEIIGEDEQHVGMLGLQRRGSQRTKQDRGKHGGWEYGCSEQERA